MRSVVRFIKGEKHELSLTCRFIFFFCIAKMAPELILSQVVTLDRMWRTSSICMNPITWRSNMKIYFSAPTLRSFYALCYSNRWLCLISLISCRFWSFPSRLLKMTVIEACGSLLKWKLPFLWDFQPKPNTWWYASPWFYLCSSAFFPLISLCSWLFGTSVNVLFCNQKQFIAFSSIMLDLNMYAIWILIPHV